MKNLSVLFIFTGVLLFTWNVLGQKSQVDSDQRSVDRMKLREQMHKKMMDRLLFDQPDDQWFDQMDQLMDQALKDMDMLYKDQTRAFQGMGQAFTSVWTQNEQGRTLKIKPQNPAQPLDVQVNGGFITIKGSSKGNNSQSEFSSSLSVPQDCDALKVKMDSKDGELLVFFPFRSKSKVIDSPDSRKPIKMKDDSVDI